MGHMASSGTQALPPQVFIRSYTQHVFTAFLLCAGQTAFAKAWQARTRRVGDREQSR